MIEVQPEMVLQYGALGLFLAYMIYDRQVILKELILTLKTMRDEMTAMRTDINELRRGKQ